jgi:peroxidase
MAARAAASAASARCSSVITLVLLLLTLATSTSSSAAAQQLSTGFYSSSCPGVYDAAKSVMQAAIAREQRIGASILRLFFHDCFVQVRTTTTTTTTGGDLRTLQRQNATYIHS